MNRFLILLIYVSSVSGVRVEAQGEIDSLKMVLRTTPTGKDKLDLYGKICWHYAGTAQLDLARQYADSVKILATALKDEKVLMRAKYYYGVIARLKFCASQK